MTICAAITEPARWIRAVWRRMFAPRGPWWFRHPGLSSVTLAVALGCSREQAEEWQRVVDQLRLDRWRNGEKFGQ